MDPFNELKGLSEASDNIIHTEKNHNKRLEEWFAIVKQITIAICKGDGKDVDDSTSNLQIPEIVSFTTEPPKKSNRKTQRISSTLAHMQKQRLSHTKKISSHSPLRNLKRETITISREQHTETTSNYTLQDPTINDTETPSNNKKRKSTQVLNGDEAEEYFTPPQQKLKKDPTTQKEDATATWRASLKRKSSKPLSATIVLKKVKHVQAKTPTTLKKPLRKSLRGQNGKISESRLPKPVSRLPSSKISVTTVSSSVLKENRGLHLKSANEDDKSKTLKKVQAERQIKIQEAKKKREEKMQKTSMQRLKLEKEKQEQLKKHQEKKLEKSLLKTVLDPKTKRLQEVENSSNSKVKSSPLSSEKTNVINSSTPMKKDANKNVEKEELENYAMTPARTSYVNYDISEIKSDDSDEENEDTTKIRKPIPEWASGVRLRNALVQQQYHPVDTDMLFGNVYESPNLVEMMGEKRKQYYKKRTSSAVWNSPSGFK